MKREPNKPTGSIGQIVISGAGSSYEPVSWPRTKPEIERYVLQSTLAGAERAGMELYRLVHAPLQNEEPNFDFTLQTRNGLEYLDLMEVAPLQLVAGPHCKAPGAYVVGEMADAIREEIRNKSNHYGTNTQVPIHLLLYSTDWRFRIGREVVDLLSSWSALREHCFTSIIYFAPSDATDGEVVPVYPRGVEDLPDINDSAARDYVVMNWNPTALLTAEPGCFEVPLMPLTSLGNSSVVATESSDSSMSTGTAEHGALPKVFISFASLTVPLAIFKDKKPSD